MSNLFGDKTPREKISHGRWKLDDKYPFFSHLSYQLKVVESEDVPTMGVDMKGVLKYNPDFIEKVDAKDMEFLIAHEVMHVSLKHHGIFKSVVQKLRRNDDLSDRDVVYHKKLLNYAGDYVINLILKDEGFQVRDDFLCKEKFRNMSTEEVYRYLRDDASDEEKPPKGGSMQDLMEKMKEYDSFSDFMDDYGVGEEYDDGEFGDGREIGVPFDEVFDDFEEENDKIDGDTEEEIREQWEQKMVDAEKYAKTRGEVSQGIEEMIGDLNKEEIDWRVFLRKELNNLCKNKYNTIKPSRRGMVHGYHLPSIEGDELSVVVALDTSGSMTQGQLRDALSEVRGILRSADNVKMKFLMHDSEVKKVIDIDGRRTRGSLMNDDRFQVVGRGGTNHIPVFNWIKNHKHEIDTDVLICFTDAYSVFPDREPMGLRTIWVVNSEQEPPFGETIWMND